LKVSVRRRDGRSLSGLELQAAYHQAARAALAGTDEETDWILREWAETLRLLQEDRGRLVGRLDWVTKQWLLETFMQEERVTWDDPWLASLDLEYHNVNPERGLFLGLEAEGKTARLTTEEDIARALNEGPADTRGGIRGLCVRRFPEQVKSVQWEEVRFKGLLTPHRLEMGDLFEPEDVKALRAILTSAASPAEALTEWHKRKEPSR
jgi:proteasome accessory factor A